MLLWYCRILNGKVPASLLILAEFVVQQLHNQEPSLNNSENVLLFPFPLTFLSKGACRSQCHPYGSVFVSVVWLFNNCCYDIKTYGLLFSVFIHINVFFNIIDPSLLLSCIRQAHKCYIYITSFVLRCF